MNKKEIEHAKKVRKISDIIENAARKYKIETIALTQALIYIFNEIKKKGMK